MKVCNNCDIVFKTDSVASDTNCPVSGCAGYVIDIDENLYESFKLLNEKGYFTVACCSGHTFSPFGHVHEESVYIAFDDVHDFPSVPKGFIIENGGLRAESAEFEVPDHTVIRKRMGMDLSGAELQRQLWETAKDVLEWAESLE